MYASVFRRQHGRALCYNGRAMLDKKQKAKVIAKNRTHETDTGSPEVQVSLLSEKIDALGMHPTEHRKDKHSRRGLLGMVSARRRHLSYLKRTDAERYAAALKQVKE